ncbi:MAG: hypothetical protein KDA28_14820, partial [Phycisphaerales bacterium]|nr:hypothetical protein [Phycisphaerales bacterium]
MSDLPLKPLSETEEFQRVGTKRRRERLAVRLDAKLKATLRSCVGTTRRRRVLAGIAALVVIGGAVGTWLAVRPTPKPDPWAGLDELFDYTLLTDDFNDLPIEERLEMIRAIIDKMKSMDSSDSVLVATFAAQIKGYARQQLEKNASRLAIDLWDDYA